MTEWLNAVTVGGIVDHDPEAGTYHLPPEHAVEGTKLQVMYMNEMYPVTVERAGSTPLFDPDDSRMKK
mgnify:CR=1 FL=1